MYKCVFGAVKFKGKEKKNHLYTLTYMKIVY